MKSTQKKQTLQKRNQHLLPDQIKRFQSENASSSSHDSVLLSQFIKRRNEELDAEIMKYKSKLGVENEENDRIYQSLQQKELKIEGNRAMSSKPIISNSFVVRNGDELQTNEQYERPLFASQSQPDDSLLNFLAKIRLSKYLCTSLLLLTIFLVLEFCYLKKLVFIFALAKHF